MQYDRMDSLPFASMELMPVELRFSKIPLCSTSKPKYNICFQFFFNMFNMSADSMDGVSLIWKYSHRRMKRRYQYAEILIPLFLFPMSCCRRMKDRQKSS